MKQIGMGFGKGRHVIKTIITGETLRRALARQQAWYEQHGVEEAYVDARTVPNTVPLQPDATRWPKDTVRARRAEKLRMAKASRPDPR